MGTGARQKGVKTRAGAFAVKDCALLAIATGRKVLTLKELRDTLATISPSSLYHHFWGGLLAPRFEEREYNNDFAAWIRHGLHDPTLAERLAVIDPTAYSDLEAMRVELLEIMDQRMDENESLTLRPAVGQFEFTRSQIVVFDTMRRLNAPHELAELVPHLSAGSVFYHFIDARSRPPFTSNDFSAWLADFGPETAACCEALSDIDPYFGSLIELRSGIAAALESLRGGRGS